MSTSRSGPLRSWPLRPCLSRAFIKQINFLVRSLNHPSLHAKKYDEGEGRWQARINQDWRFYFKIDGDTYRIAGLKPHPK